MSDPADPPKKPPEEERPTLPQIKAVDPILGDRLNDDPPTIPALRMVCCPKCRGVGEIRELIETGPGYRTKRRLCDLCEGTARVPAARYREYSSRNHNG